MCGLVYEESVCESGIKFQKGSQWTYNLTLVCFFATIVAVEKQKLLHILSVLIIQRANRTHHGILSSLA
jgi:hypothetical protein